MVIVSPLSGVIPPSEWGVTNYLLTGMILQVRPEINTFFFRAYQPFVSLNKAETLNPYL